MADVVFIGAGPVGIWTALQIRQRCPEAEIVMYERHQTYQRSHVLRLEHWSMMLYASGQNDEAARCFYAEIADKSLRDIRKEFAKSLFIRTNELEAALLGYARSKNIDIRYYRVTSPAELEGLHPECRIFVCGDGANSSMRAALLGDDCLEKYDLQFVVELKYEETGTSRRFNTAQAWRYNTRLHHTAMDYVGKSREGRTPVTLRLLLAPDVYAKLPEMSFARPHLLETGGLPDCVEADVQTYLAQRQAEFGTIPAAGTGKLSKLVLSMYAASHFAVKRENAGWFLVGDAAMGVPYFRALNSGMILGSRLAQILAARDRHLEHPLDRKIRAYNRYRPWHVQTEFAIARSKDAMVDGFGWVRERFADPHADGSFSGKSATSFSPD